MRKKHKKICTILNYIQHFLILASTIKASGFLRRLGIKAPLSKIPLVGPLLF